MKHTIDAAVMERVRAEPAVKTIPLTKGKFAIVDAEDYDFLMQWKWCFSRRYAASWGGKENPQMMAMHRVINKTPHGLYTDHINGNGLDNRKENLRTATPSQNLINSPASGISKYKGVSWHKRDKKWQVFIQKNGQRSFVGNYRNEELASLAYNAAAIKIHGEFARLNQPKTADSKES